MGLSDFLQGFDRTRFIDVPSGRIIIISFVRRDRRPTSGEMRGKAEMCARAQSVCVSVPCSLVHKHSNAALVLTRSTKEEGVSEESGRKFPCAFRPSSSSGASFESICNPSADAVPALANSISSKQEWYEPYKNCVCHARRGSVVFVKV